jgi:DNA-directed RNA polymerase subunit RPC12/RpoP
MLKSGVCPYCQDWVCDIYTADYPIYICLSCGRSWNEKAYEESFEVVGA